MIHLLQGGTQSASKNPDRAPVTRLRPALHGGQALLRQPSGEDRHERLVLARLEADLPGDPPELRPDLPLRAVQPKKGLRPAAWPAGNGGQEVEGGLDGLAVPLEFRQGLRPGQEPSCPLPAVERRIEAGEAVVDLGAEPLRDPMPIEDGEDFHRVAARSRGDHLDPLESREAGGHADLLAHALARALHAIDGGGLRLHPPLGAQAALELRRDLHRGAPPRQLERGPLAYAHHVAILGIGLLDGLVPGQKPARSSRARSAEEKGNRPPTRDRPHPSPASPSRERGGRITFLPTRRTTPLGARPEAGFPSSPTNWQGESTIFWSGSIRSAR